MLILNKSKMHYNKTPMWETGCLSIFLGRYLVSLALHSGFSGPWRSPPALSSTLTQGYFFECLGIQFFNSITCDFQDAMPHQSSLTLMHREAEDFRRGGNHSRHMPLLTYLAWLQPIYYDPKFVFKHVKTEKFCLWWRL